MNYGQQVVSWVPTRSNAQIQGTIEKYITEDIYDAGRAVCQFPRFRQVE